MGFVLRKLVSPVFRYVSKNVSNIIGFIFGAFKKMPVRVSLAIVGSIYLVLTFIFAVLWGWFAVTIENEEISKSVQDSFTVILVIVLIWISIATFIPSLERQSEVVHVTEEPSTKIIEVQPKSVAVVEEDEPELVE